MRIWIIEIGEPLPIEEDPRLLRYGLFSPILARSHDVTWWASSFSHSKKAHFSELDCDIDYDNVRLKLIRGPGYQKNISIARIRHATHFSRRFTELAQSMPKPDLIITTIPTLEVSEAAVKFAKDNKIPVISDIRDVWPDELVNLFPRLLRPIGRIVLRSYFQKMKYICENSTALMGVSETFLDYGLSFANRCRNDLDLVFPLGYPANKKAVTKEAEYWCESLGLKEEDFVICFFGTIGKFFDLSTVIKCAVALQDTHPQIKFVLAGDGSNLARFRKEAQGCQNIIFPGWLSNTQISAVLNRAHVGLAPYHINANMELPNKVFEYFSAGIPVLSSLRGSLSQILKNNDCGISYTANDPEELSASIVDLFTRKHVAALMGENGRRLLEKKYSTDVVFAETAQLFKKVALHQPND